MLEDAACIIIKHGRMAKDSSMAANLPGGVESLRLKVGGEEVHYLKAGNGRPVVLLHGGANDSRDWVKTMTALSASNTLYAPDIIGYGLSDNNRDGYRLSDFVEFTIGFAGALNLICPAMVGHSIGGRVCLEIALRYPERVCKLVLVDSSGFSRLARFGSFIGCIAWEWRKILSRSQPYPRLLKDEGGYADPMCLGGLTSLGIPTLILWSRCDPYYPLAGAIRAAKLIPGAHLEILPCYGHAPHRSKRDHFNSLLADFLNHNHGSEV